MKTIFSLIGVVLMVSQVVPYLLLAWKGEARPNVVSWGTWTLLTLIGAAAAITGGNWRAGLVVLGSALGSGAVALVGLRHGYAKMGRLDAVCQVLALVGLALWPLLRAPTATVAITIGVDALALIPTLRHAWRAPQEEAWASFALAAVGGACGLLAVRQHDFVGYAYPLYLLCADLLVVGFVLGRRSRMPTADGQEIPMA
jgi:hypothetical protein